jgi:hypothetical protein
MDSDDVYYLPRIYFILHQEWWWDYFSPNLTSWKDYILLKNLGLDVLDDSLHTYRIIDEKKWLLTKIKYGL